MMDGIKVSERVAEKATALYDQHRVVLLGHDRAAVIGDCDVYCVTAHSGGGFTCTCPALGARCAHIAAASLAWADAG